MNRIDIRLLLPLAVALQAANLPAQPNSAPMVVHEWGTFTSLQDETGHAIGGINTDDEPVPKFVHRIADWLLLSPTEVPATYFQGAPSCHPDVTMRLETPVLYFHPSPAQPVVQGVNVNAEFRGGWLSEFYPDANVNAPGVSNNIFGPLSSSTVGTLAWTNLEVGGHWSGPATDEHVWTSPRAVNAASVRTAAGEAEKFLFYRGVAHIDAPIAVVQDARTEELLLHSQLPSEISGHGPLNVHSLWLVDIAASGKVAFRFVPPMTLSGNDQTPLRISSHFAPGDYSEANRRKLETSLRDALVAAGLFDDEARALLNTWELSYFKSTGMRLFFLVPRAWTDFYLPLKISVPSQLTRVMVGRIELVTPDERNNLRQIAETSTNDIASDAMSMGTNYFARMLNNTPDLREVFDGKMSLKAFGISVPKSYQLYLALGRFRNALILDEAQRRPSPSLDHFIQDYRLAGYKPVELSAAEVPRNQ